MPTAHTHVTTAPTRLAELESIRGLAALTILYYHIPAWNELLRPAFIEQFYVVVDLFFVLSGFVIHRSYSQTLTSGPAFTHFVLLRIGRVYPLHLLFLLAFLGIESAKYIALEHLGIISPNTQPFQQNNWTAFIQNLFLVQAIGPTGNTTTFNFPSWSISVEMAAYLLFGVLCLTTRRLRPILFIGLAAGSFLTLLTTETLGFDPLLRCIAGFFTGCLTEQLTRKRPTGLAPGLLFPPLSLGAIALFILFKSGQGDDPLIYPLSSLLIASLALSAETPVHRILRHRWLLALGTLSYSLYMSHAAVFWTVNQAVRLISSSQETVSATTGINTPYLPTDIAVLVEVFALLLTFMISAVLSHWVETPARQAFRRLAERFSPQRTHLTCRPGPPVSSP